MPTPPDGSVELWRRRLERLREKFVVIADRQRQEPPEFLELVLVHYDVGCEAHRDATEKHLEVRQIVLPGSKTPVPKQRFTTLQNRRPTIGEIKYESVETTAGSCHCRYDEGGKLAWRCVYPRMRLPIVTNVQSDDEVLARRGRIQRSEREFRELADEGSDILNLSPTPIVERFPVQSWKHCGSAGWMLCLFEVAWIGTPGLNADRWIVSPIAECPIAFPYDVTCFQQSGDLADLPQRFPAIKPYFDTWAVELPGCFFSILPNANEVSVAFIDWLLSKSINAGNPSTSVAASTVIHSALSAKGRLHIDDIDSFAEVRNVLPNAVSQFLTDGKIEVLEDSVKRAIEEILHVPFHHKDCPNELDDIYTANVIVNGSRRPTAFMLKGRGIRKKEMTIADCGKNGDQLVRLFDAPADLFVVQFVGRISEMVIKDVEDKIAALRQYGKYAQFLIVDGQDTARLLLAYGMLNLT